MNKKTEKNQKPASPSKRKNDLKQKIIELYDNIKVIKKVKIEDKLLQFAAQCKELIHQETYLIRFGVKNHIANELFSLAYPTKQIITKKQQGWRNQKKSDLLKQYYPDILEENTTNDIHEVESTDLNVTHDSDSSDLNVTHDSESTDLNITHDTDSSDLNVTHDAESTDLNDTHDDALFNSRPTNHDVLIADTADRLDEDADLIAKLIDIYNASIIKSYQAWSIGLSACCGLLLVFAFLNIIPLMTTITLVTGLNFGMNGLLQYKFHQQVENYDDASYSFAYKFIISSLIVLSTTSLMVASVLFLPITIQYIAALILSCTLYATFKYTKNLTDVRKIDTPEQPLGSPTTPAISSDLFKQDPEAKSLENASSPDDSLMSNGLTN